MKGTENSLVTIIALCCNQAKYVYEALESIRNQTYKNLQLIIIDDGSSDNSVEVIENWIDQTSFKCSFFPQKQNLGICKTLNAHLKYVNGEYYQVIACDDVLIDNKIETQIHQFMQLDKDYALVYCDLYKINEFSEVFGVTPFTERGWIDSNMIPSGNLFVQLSKQCFIAAPTVLIKTIVLNDIKYDESLLFEDWDMWLAISMKYKIKGFNNKLVKYRIHNRSMFQTRNFKHVDSELMICKKYMGIHPTADVNFKAYIYRESIQCYMHGGIRLTYWLWQRFLIKPGISNFLHVLLTLAGISYQQKEKWRKRLSPV